MVRMLTRFFLVTVLLAGVGRVGAFSLNGPQEAYQVPTIGYLADGPKNLGEEYRMNRPVLYYAANANFLDYFGSNGLYAVESAFSLLNGLTNVSSYTSNLTDIPLETMRENFQAQALGLLDLKSETLTYALSELGLASAETWIWGLHNRYNTGPPCPAGMVYDVIKRNFDYVFTSPDLLQPSSYVNGTLYSYQILEFCTGPNPLADAVEFAVDPTASTYTAVSSEFNSYGQFFTGLTRDDIAGLRYLLRTNNYNIESAGFDTVTFITNNTPQLLFTSNLFDFISTALVTDGATLAALYPGLNVASSIQVFTNVITTNTIFYFTNYPFDPAGTPPRLITASVLETNVTVHYNHTFANAYITPSYQLVSNWQVPSVPGHSAPIGLVGTIITNISASACGPFSPAGSICTNTSIAYSMQAGPFGDFYILPTNLCAVSIVATQFTSTITVTNPLSGVIVTLTNSSGQTVGLDSLYSQTPTYNFTQYVYVIRPVECPQDSVGLRQGIERVQFVRRDFDSLLGRFFYPVTNSYTVTALTNNTLVQQQVVRLITEPDFLIDAQDLAPGPGANAPVVITRRTFFWDENNVNPGLAGPGKIEPGSTLTFNKVGPIYQNVALNFLDEAGQSLFFIWGSFDGSTNAPIVYPNGTDILNLENQVLIQISPSGPALPNGQIGVNYTGAFSGFTVTGGTPPYQWSIPQGSGGLPPGLSLNSSTGQIIGIPTAQNIYDFTIRMTDSTSRFVDRNYSITITP